jgi:hypothetical protein
MTDKIIVAVALGTIIIVVVGKTGGDHRGIRQRLKGLLRRQPEQPNMIDFAATHQTHPPYMVPPVSEKPTDQSPRALEQLSLADPLLGLLTPQALMIGNGANRTRKARQ